MEACGGILLAHLRAVACRHLLINLALVAISFYSWGHALAQPARFKQISQSEPPIPQRDFSAFLPALSVLTKQLTVDFRDGGPGIVLAYGPDESRPSGPDLNVGVRVLRYNRSSGWTVGFEESDSVLNGGGPFEAITIEKLISTGGKEGVVVILKNSGAGISTDWHIVAAASGKFFKLDPAATRDKALKSKNYQFMGYNVVSSKGDVVIEKVPGYSNGRARCCPDRPSIEIRFRFTGASIRLDSMKELPFTPQKY
jgi:hypothetical protein